MVEPFSSLLRAEADPIWQRIFVNPFLKELRQGTLPIEKFRFYLAQDYLYLEGFARTVAVALALAKGAGINTVDPNGGQTSSLAIGIDGFPLIAYIAGQGALTVAHCTDVACAGVEITGVDFTQNNFPSVAIGSDDFPLIAYNNFSDLNAAHCPNIGCTNPFLP